MEKNFEKKKSEKNNSTFGNYKISIDNPNNLEQN
jgi:hypothetical protein